MVPVFHMDFVGKLGIRVPDDKGWHQPCPNFDLMQFTGLFDKNGKEIYEGDIIGRWRRDYNGKNCTLIDEEPGVVMWSENWSGWCTETLDGKCRTGFLLGTSIFEVIGNIHENGYLLK